LPRRTNLAADLRASKTEERNLESAVGDAELKKILCARFLSQDASASRNMRGMFASEISFFL
jgi:hypothetical protein